MMKNIYTHLYDDPKRRYDLPKSPRIQVMLKIIDGLNLENKKILDIGCYDGTLLNLIKNRKNEFYGLEGSLYGAEESRKKGIQVNNFFLDDQTRLPYADGMFNLVIAGEIIEHIYDTDFFLEEIYRILMPGGKLIISTPNIASLGRRLLLLFGINPLIEIAPNAKDSSGHIRYFTSKTLKKLLEKHKLKNILSKSDTVNFSNSGRIKSDLLAKIYPGIGTSLIYLAKKPRDLIVT